MKVSTTRGDQLGPTVNASLPFGDLVVSASYFDRDFRYEADATDYEFRFNWQVACHNAQGEAIVADDTCVDETFVRSTYYLSYDFGGDPHGHATNHEETDITTLEARLQSRNDSQSRWSWLIGAFYSEERVTQSSIDSSTATRTPRRSSTSATTSDTWVVTWPRPIRGSWAGTTPSWTRWRYSAESVST
jgi:hypothetical protein